MLNTGPAKKVTIYINEDTQTRMVALHDAIMSYLIRADVSGATATRAYSGFGSHRVLHTPKIELLSAHMPIRIEFIESPERVESILPALAEMVTDGMIEVRDTTVVRIANPETPPLPHERRQGHAILLRVFFGEADQWQDEPLHTAIIRKLRGMGIDGATVFRGILGYGAKGHEHRKSFFHPMRDLPVMISVIDTPEKISRAAEAIEAMLTDGLLVFSDVEIIRFLRSTNFTEVASAKQPSI